MYQSHFKRSRVTCGWWTTQRTAKRQGISTITGRSRQQHRCSHLTQRFDKGLSAALTSHCSIQIQASRGFLIKMCTGMALKEAWLVGLQSPTDEGCVRKRLSTGRAASGHT